MDEECIFPCLNGANYHIWVNQITTLLCSMPTLDDDNYDLVCLKEDEALGLIAVYVEPNLVHHIKNNKSAK
jgi:hypothetical protein